jgi:hypothetical protein
LPTPYPWRRWRSLLGQPQPQPQPWSGRRATGNRLITLTKALSSIDGDICIDAAERLESLSVSTTKFNLHLRQAGLGWAGLGWAGLGWAGLATSDAGLLADALQSLKTDEGTSLNFFSLSYNAGIGDEGASLIANSLPTNLPKLGIGLATRAAKRFSAGHVKPPTCIQCASNRTGSLTA